MIKTVPGGSELIRRLTPDQIRWIYGTLADLIASAFDYGFRLDPTKHISFEAPQFDPKLTRLSAPIEIVLVPSDFQGCVKMQPANESMIQERLARSILDALYQQGNWSNSEGLHEPFDLPMVRAEYNGYFNGKWQLVSFAPRNPVGLHV